MLAESQYDWDMGIVGGEQPTWAQYHERDPENAALYETCGAGHAKALLSMPPADRIAMARELLEGTGWEVAQTPRISGWQPAKRCKYAGYSQTLRISSDQRQACGCDNCKRVLFGVGRGAI